ncbi:MAG: hypothetical protein AAGN66_05045 [Acidobacteriota bacterium]
MTRPSLEEVLARLDSAPDDGSDPVDPVLLAEWIDGVLEGDEREAFERRLASSKGGRALAREVAENVALGEFPMDHGSAGETPPPRGRSGPGRIFVGPAARWLVAAALALVVAGGLWLGRWDPRLEALGVDRMDLWRSPGLASVALDGLDGDWPVLDGFGSFLTDQDVPRLRAASAPRVPEPLSPRWTWVRPGDVTLRWTGPGSTFEVLVVDDLEQPVGTIRIEPRGGDDGVHGAPWPPDATPPEPGRAYAWKVNARIDGEWVASEYVPFRVLDTRRAESLDDRLQGLDGYLAASALAREGLYGEAVDVVAHLSVDDGDLRRDLLRSMLARQRWDADALDRVVERHLGSLR